LNLDSAAAIGYFFVTQSIDAVYKFLLSITGINNMGMAIAPARQYYLSDTSIVLSAIVLVDRPLSHINNQIVFY
jgi:hypothetical protein